MEINQITAGVSGRGDLRPPQQKLKRYTPPQLRPPSIAHRPAHAASSVIPLPALFLLHAPEGHDDGTDVIWPQRRHASRLRKSLPQIKNRAYWFMSKVIFAW
ncbi:hypothetical protein [Aquamicrobium sp.]|uniref:hypothetical protein n=1 Tax=Aquamicrobium sp. TaxID=1872579 RepID=UPI0025910B89|nr:hypothetical protein [Aquamicrobium sp.]MCK9549156.1 hypothetical protein [Aquamicrobium sp.]